MWACAQKPNFIDFLKNWSGKRDLTGLAFQLATPGRPAAFATTLTFNSRKEFGAGNEIRTRDPNLGKVVLYQLSYSR